MARYILLGKFSLNGVKGVINSSADRASEAKKAVEAAGGKFISYDFTRGTYDFVGIADGLNDATASALKGVILSSGDFEQIDMLNHYCPVKLSNKLSCLYLPTSCIMESFSLSSCFNSVFSNRVRLRT